MFLNTINSKVSFGKELKTRPSESREHLDPNDVKKPNVADPTQHFEMLNQAWNIELRNGAFVSLYSGARKTSTSTTSKSTKLTKLTKLV